MNNGWRSAIGFAAAVTVVGLGLTGVHALNTPGHGVSLVMAHPSPQLASPTATSSPTSQTFHLTGGTVTFSCANGVISIDAATPNAGFTVEQEVKDEGARAEVRFESATHESRLEASCVGDQIRVDELREEAIEEQAPPAPPTAPPSMTRTFNLVGGTVTVTCTGNVLRVDSATPNPGFSMEQERKDDDNAAEFRFEGKNHESRLEVSCAGGQVQVEELREENS
jgi:hypothetical protein